VIPVLDVAGGMAVHARGGVRAAYAPVRSVLSPVEGDVARLAGAFRDALGLDELYLADLDAIVTGAAPTGFVRVLAGSGVRVWLDAGVSGAARARMAVAEGADRVIIGLETLPSALALEEIVAEVGGERLAFSVDLRDGMPVMHPAAAASGLPVESLALAELAIAIGIHRLIVLDLARVGSERGIEAALPRAIRARAPGVELVAGGGVRDMDDLATLARAGCDAALVGTALHEGRIGARDLARLASLGGGSRGDAPTGDR
jgi:phosphoribosylformimino-5-aminoimidazole carboxamide ribotide isomerase